MLGIVLSSVFICLISIFFTMFIISFLFIQDFSATENVFKNAFETSISRTKQSQILKESTNLLNEIFKEVISKIVQSKDITLQKDLNINEKEVKSFKKELNNILRDHEKLISYEALEDYSKQTKQFNFFNLIKSNTRFYSSDKVLALSKLIDLYKKGQINSQELVREMNKINSLNKIEIKKYISKLQKKDYSTLFKFSNLPAKLFNISGKKSDTLKFIYDAWNNNSMLTMS